MTVLYADDDPEDRELFADAVREVSPDVILILAQDGKETMELLNSSLSIPDFIFLDINMPLVSGKDCLKMLRMVDKFRNVPVIIYTTTSNKEEFQNLVHLGAQNCIVKGVSYQAVKDDLRNILSTGQ